MPVKGGLWDLSLGGQEVSSVALGVVIRNGEGVERALRGEVAVEIRVARWILPDSANFNSPYGQLELFTATVNKKSFLALFLRILAEKISRFLSEI